MVGVRWLVVVLGIAVLCARPMDARAADPEPPTDVRVLARRVAQQGVRLYREGKYAAAIEKLQRAEKIFHAPTHLLFMARAHSELGQLVKAHRLFVQLATEQIPDYAVEAFHRAQKEAQQRLAQLRSKITGVLIVVTGAPNEQIQFRIDGELISPAKLAFPVALEPAEYQVEVQAPDMVTVRRSIEVKAEPGPQRLLISLTAATPDEPTPGSLVPGIIVTSVGVVGLALGAITGGVTLSKASDVKDHCDGTQCPIEQESSADAARTLGHVSTASFIVGSVAAAVGITLLIVRPGGSEGHKQAGEASATNGIQLGLRCGVGTLQLFGRF